MIFKTFALMLRFPFNLIYWLIKFIIDQFIIENYQIKLKAIYVEYLFNLFIMRLAFIKKEYFIEFLICP